MEKSIFRNLETRKFAFFLKLDVDSVPQRGAQGADLGSEVMFTRGIPVPGSKGARRHNPEKTALPLKEEVQGA